MKRNVLPLVVAMSLVLPAGPAVAQGWQWLQNSPLEYFNDKDWDLMRGTTNELLDSQPDGSARMWDNPDTGNKGQVTVLSSGEHDGMKCRRTRFHLEAKNGLTSSGLYRMCKMPDGTWKFAP